MTTTTKTAAELLAERKALNNAIRAAQRAEKAAAAKAILDAQHALGLWLAEATELTTVDAVEAARAGLDLDAVRALVHAALAGDDEYPRGTPGSITKAWRLKIRPVRPAGSVVGMVIEPSPAPVPPSGRVIGEGMTVAMLKKQPGLSGSWA